MQGGKVVHRFIAVSFKATLLCCYRTEVSYKRHSPKDVEKVINCLPSPNPAITFGLLCDRKESVSNGQSVLGCKICTLGLNTHFFHMKFDRFYHELNVL